MRNELSAERVQQLALYPTTVRVEEVKSMAVELNARRILSDGGFSCAPDFAVKVAHMMSCAGAAYDEDSAGVTEVLELYMRGTHDEDECIRIFQEEWPKAFPGLHPLEFSND